jgi:hypothetical protein
MEVRSLFDDEMFDIIVDDGLHTMTGIKLSLSHLFTKLKKSGVYVIEDIQNKDLFNEMIGSFIFLIIQIRKLFY